jgi:hypothetical protein
MARNPDKTYYVTNQPIRGNPFEELNGEWTVDLCSCFDNISQCKLF